MPQPQLKFFQQIGRDFLARRTRALLADDMRLGKTWQAITACDLVGAQRILVVCPAVATENVWLAAFEELSPGREVVIGPPHEGTADVRVVSYDQARIHLGAIVAEPQWDVLIVDETHFCKNPEAKRAKAVFGKGGLGWKADRIWALSGTPAPNHAGELWVLARAFGATQMGYINWCYHFCIMKDERPVATRRDRVVELRRLLEPFMLRRMKKEAAPELPPMTVEPWKIKSSTRFLDVIRPGNYSELVRMARKDEERLRRELNKLPESKHADYLAQKAESYSAMRRLNGILKTPGVYEQVVYELEHDLVDKIVIFAYHREPIILLHELFREKFGSVHVYGGTPKKKKDAAVRKWSRKNGPRVFIGQILAAGTAIDLSAAHQGIMLEKDWVPGNNLQALDRMGGFKQTMPVTVRDAMLDGGIDSFINETLLRKQEELAAIFD